MAFARSPIVSGAVEFHGICNHIYSYIMCEYIFFLLRCIKPDVFFCD